MPTKIVAARFKVGSKGTPDHDSFLGDSGQITGVNQESAGREGFDAEIVETLQSAWRYTDASGLQNRKKRFFHR